ncbi:hypothetical protein OROMI_015087 [Orobanche minor]
MAQDFPSGEHIKRIFFLRSLLILLANTESITRDPITRDARETSSNLGALHRFPIPQDPTILSCNFSILILSF